MSFQTASKWLEALANGVVVLGIVLFFIQDHLEKRRDKIERSARYSTLFQSGDYQTSRFALVKPWFERSHELEAMHKAGASKAARRKFIRDVFHANSELPKAPYEIEGFFGAVRDCIESNACDKVTAERLLGKFASDVYCFYEPALDVMSSQYLLENFGENLRFFSKVAGGCDDLSKLSSR